MSPIGKSSKHQPKNIKMTFQNKGLAKCRRHGWIRIEILCRMVWLRDSLLSWRPFLCQIPVFMSPPLFADPIPKSVVVTKAFAPKFCAEFTDRHIHSSHGDSFRDNFCVCVSGQLSGNFRATFKQLPGNFQATSGQLSGNFQATLGQPSGNFRATFGQLSGNFWTTFVASITTDMSNGQKH